MSVKAYAQLMGAIAFEVFGTTCLKASDGFTIPLFIVGSVVGYLVSFTFMIYALKELPLGLTYGIWGGIGTVATAVIGLVGWGEPITGLMFAGIVLITAGVFLLNKGTEELEAARS